MNRIILGLAFALIATASASAASSPCGGNAAPVGAELRGPVLHVLDGRTLCVATGADPAQWVEVELQDAPASASWGALMSVAFGKDAACTVNGEGRVAVCRIGGRSVGPQLAQPRVAEAGRAWRAHAEPAPPLSPSIRIAAIDD